MVGKRTSATKDYKGLFNSPKLPSPGNTPMGPPPSSEVNRVAKIKIENVVASTSLGEQLDLQAIALALGGAEYEPEQFPGLIYRLKEPKTATLLFRSGKVVCTGAKSLEHVKTAIDMPKVVVLLFGSGKLVCTGARKPSDVEQAVEKITEELKAAGLLR